MATAEPTAVPGDTADLSAPAADSTARELPLDVLSARSAVRGTPGACPGGGAQLEVSDDGGVTWQGISTPVELLLRAARPQDRELWVVGAIGPDCTPGFATSADAAAAWVGPSETTGAWHLLADPATTSLHAPNSEVPSPCGDRRTLEVEPVSFSQASVLCGDGEVFGTADAGVTWASSGATPGANALGLSGDRPLVAAPSDGDCDGLAIGSPGEQPIGCVSDAPADGVSLSFADAASGWVVAGGRTWTTTDGGVTWGPR